MIFKHFIFDTEVKRAIPDLPLSKILFWFFIANFLLLGFIGARPIETPYYIVSRTFKSENPYYKKVKKGRSIDSIIFHINKKQVADDSSYKLDDPAYIDGKIRQEESEKDLVYEAMKRTLNLNTDTINKQRADNRLKEIEKEFKGIDKRYNGLINEVVQILGDRTPLDPETLESLKSVLGYPKETEQLETEKVMLLKARSKKGK